jgi:hypothetical protein
MSVVREQLSSGARDAICCKQRSTELRQAQLPRLRPELVEGSRRSQRFAIAHGVCLQTPGRPDS